MPRKELTMHLARNILCAGLLAFYPAASDLARAQATNGQTVIVPPAVAMVEQPCPVVPDDLPPVLAEPGKPAPPDTAFAQRYAAVRAYRQKYDWPGLCRFRAENAAILERGRPLAVFMGDSITEAWIRYDPDFFGTRIADRGISGQTSPQMLLRFYQDVVSLHPRVVHIMSGTNDIAGNTGPTTARAFQDNIRAMVDIARANGIRVVLASIPPTAYFPWRQDIKLAAQVTQLNAWLKVFARDQHIVYADYYAAMAMPDGSMKPQYTFDGTHPGTAGYKVMSGIARTAIARAARSSR